MKVRLIGGAVALAGLLALAPVVRADATLGCSAAMPAGDWANFGGPDHMGSNRQDAPHDITESSAASLQEAWHKVTTYQSEPIVSGGCLYVTNDSRVEAYDVNDGTLVWASNPDDLEVTGAFAVAVADGRVHVNVANGNAPLAAALDAHDGHLLWKSDPVTFGYEAWQDASAVVFNGLHVLFTTGPDFDPHARPGYAIIDAASGEILHAQTTIPAAELDAGYAGGGVWGTPTVDPVSKYLFAGTANPDSLDREHKYDNAVLKIDLDPTRATFGEIVSSWKGEPDSLTGYDNPVCQSTASTVPHVFGQTTCAQGDWDFGTSPTLWRDADGLHLAILQKTGTVHVLDADTMTEDWNKTVGSNSLLMATSGNLSRIATDGTSLFVVANHGILWSIDIATHQRNWTAITKELGAGGNVAYSNGVVYHVFDGKAHGYDATTGQEIWTGAPTLATGERAGTNGPPASGVAIAGNRIVANLAGLLAVFELPRR